ncbi:MAG: hypothetical protein ACOCQX_02140 [Candidatus Nanoarchaeia archaeon]
MFKKKKAKMSTEHWAEWVSLMLLIVGLVLSAISDAAIITYIVIFLCGVFVGRIYYLRRTEIGFPFYMIVIFFLVGYFLGVEIRQRGIVLMCLLFFAAGAFIGKFLHEKGYFK